MPSRKAVLASAGIGAALMYYFDPDRGRRRRSLARDRMVHVAHRAQAGMDAAARDLRNRVSGTLATLRAVDNGTEVSDEVLRQRVRAQLGRVVSHPGSIEVLARDGVVTLSGPVLTGEVPRLLDRVLAVPGVRNIEDRLEAYDDPRHVPGLQGDPPRRGFERGAFRQTCWSPAERALAGAGGGLLALYGLRARGLARLACTAGGLTLFGRAASNLELRRLTGVGARRRAVDVQKTIHIKAPVEQVYAVWENFENFPSFMTHVHGVQRLDDGREQPRWRWTVTGPAGLELQFDTVTTAQEPARLLTWRTEPGSMVQHAGRVRFQPEDSGTMVDIKMTYAPVAGALGHVVARLFGADPKHRMDDDLMRMKTYIETGIPPHDAAVRRVARAPVARSSVAPPPV